MYLMGDFHFFGVWKKNHQCFLQHLLAASQKPLVLQIFKCYHWIQQPRKLILGAKALSLQGKVAHMGNFHFFLDFEKIINFFTISTSHSSKTTCPTNFLRLPLDSATSKTYTGGQSCIFTGKGCSHGKFALFGLRNFYVGSFDQISKWEVLTNRILPYTIVQT